MREARERYAMGVTGRNGEGVIERNITSCIHFPGSYVVCLFASFDFVPDAPLQECKSSQLTVDWGET